MACRSRTRICTTSQGKLAECGSKIRKGWIAPATATAIERLEAAGAIRLGALNMAEFAYGPTGHNLHTGHVRNPWNPDAHHRRLVVRLGRGGRRAAGPAALGSDTGGSIRMPAHFCGVTGLKAPTAGSAAPRDAALVHARHCRAARTHARRIAR